MVTLRVCAHLAWIFYTGRCIFTIHLICPVLFAALWDHLWCIHYPYMLMIHPGQHSRTCWHYYCGSHTHSSLCYFRYLTFSPTSYSFSPSFLFSHPFWLYIISFLILLVTCIHIQPYERPHSLCLYWSLCVGMSARDAGWLDGAGAVLGGFSQLPT